ncbi:MAG: AAA family ATPase, partial [Selenomonadaceae bacterium]
MTVKKNMPIGVTDFKKVREGYYFVDKTDFIRQFIDGHSEATLITRPRRFGKTLFLSMMDWFFSIDKRDESEGLFDGLDIACAGSSYMAERGTRPVIFLSLKGIEADTWAYARKIYEMRISDLYRSFPYLWTSGKLNEYDKKRGQKIAGGVADEVEYQDGLSALSRLLTAYHGAKPVMLIDEYDAPLQYAYQHGYYDDAVVYFRTCFNAAFKDNPYLDFAIITGVLRVAKESIFSGLNSLDVCSVTTEKYRESCGFTQAEIDKMASDLGFEKKIDEIKEWYDGYHFGDADIYNPWSVISYVSEGFAARPYWTNTSSNVILRKLLARLDHVRIKELRGLMSGGCVRASINESMIYESIGKNDTDLYNVLLTTGYLTTEKDSTKNERRMTRMTIPNKEIEQVYATEILDAITPNLRSDDFFRALECMLDGDAEDFE